MTVEVSEPTTLRQLVGGAVTVGIGGYAGLIVAGQPFAAVVVWVTALIAATSLRWRVSVPLFDERDETISGEAARVTLAVVGIASGVVFPAVAVAGAVGAFEWTAWSVTLALGIAGLYAVYGVVGRRR